MRATFLLPFAAAPLAQTCTSIRTAPHTLGTCHFLHRTGRQGEYIPRRHARNALADGAAPYLAIPLLHFYTHARLYRAINRQSLSARARSYPFCLAGGRARQPGWAKTGAAGRGGQSFAAGTFTRPAQRHLGANTEHLCALPKTITLVTAAVTTTAPPPSPPSPTATAGSGSFTLTSGGCCFC